MLTYKYYIEPPPPPPTIFAKLSRSKEIWFKHTKDIPHAGMFVRDLAIQASWLQQILYTSAQTVVPERN